MQTENDFMRHWRQNGEKVNSRSKLRMKPISRANGPFFIYFYLYFSFDLFPLFEQGYHLNTLDICKHVYIFGHPFLIFWLEIDHFRPISCLLVSQFRPFFLAKCRLVNLEALI